MRRRSCRLSKRRNSLGSTEMTGAWWMKQILKDAARKPLQAEHVCVCAREGWGLAQDALKEVLTEAQQRGEQLSASLTAYDIALRQGLVRCGGPERGKTFLRNIVIYDIVEAMRERFGLCPTRSRSARPGKERLSGCYVAYLALKEERDALSEPAVERIWAEYEPIFRSPMWRSTFLSATAFTISST